MKKEELIVILSFATVGGVFSIIAATIENFVAKSVCSILGIVFGAVCVFLVIDVVVKKYKKPKDLTDKVVDFLKEEMKKTNFEEDFIKKIESNSEKRERIYEGQLPDKDDYGYCKNNPITTSSPSSSEDYLKMLRTPDGEFFRWKRTGSCCVPEINGVKNVMVDEYMLELNDENFKTIYICPYGRNSSYVPKGLVLEEKRKLEDEANKKGMSVDQLIYLHILTQKEEKELKKFDEQTNKIKLIYPDFNLSEEMKNPIFKELVNEKINMQSVYEVLHKSDLLVKKNIGVALNQDSNDQSIESYYDVLYKNDDYLINLQTKENLKKKFQEGGFTAEQIKLLIKIENENREIKIKNHKSNCLNQSEIAKKIKFEYPQFDLNSALLNNEFKRLVYMGIDMQIVYEIIYIDELFDRKNTKT